MLNLKRNFDNEIREIHKKGEYYKNKTCKDCVDLIYPVNG